MGVTKQNALDAVRAALIPEPDIGRLLHFIGDLTDAQVLSATKVLTEHDSATVLAGCLLQALEATRTTPVEQRQRTDAIEAKVESIIVEQAYQQARHHTVTEVGTIGKVINNYSPRNSGLVVPKPHPLPSALDATFVCDWDAASSEKDIQELAVKAITALLLELGPSGLTVLDTHASKYYHNPTAKIDLTVSDTKTALWLGLVMPIELKHHMEDAASFNECVGQVHQRRVQAREGGQQKRDLMYGVAWSKESLVIIKHTGDRNILHTTTGKLPFAWDVRNDGYQALCGVLCKTLPEHGFVPVAVPPPCTLTDTATGQTIMLSGFQKLASDPFGTRMVLTCDAVGGPMPSGIGRVVAKLGTKQQVEKEYAMIDKRQDVDVLPRAWGCGELSEPYNGLTSCFLSGPVGQHLEDGDEPLMVLRAFADLACGLGQLANPQQTGYTALFHRDLSPSNFVVYKNEEGVIKVLLLDLHVATSDSGGGPRPERVEEQGATGKTLFISLRLIEQHDCHSLPMDLESLMYSFLDIASDGLALRWRHCGQADMQDRKFATMFRPRSWEKAVAACREEFKPALKRLHQLIFYNGSVERYLQSSPPVTAEGFEACMRAAIDELLQPPPPAPQQQ